MLYSEYQLEWLPVGTMGDPFLVCQLGVKLYPPPRSSPKLADILPLDLLMELSKLLW